MAEDCCCQRYVVGKETFQPKLKLNIIPQPVPLFKIGTQPNQQIQRLQSPIFIIAPPPSITSPVIPLVKQNFIVPSTPSRIGLHVRLQNNLLTALTTGPARQVSQIYLTPRTGTSVRAISRLEKEHIRAKLDQQDETFYIHCPLHLNLARQSGDSFLTTSQRVILEETAIVQNLPGACVLHIGNGKRGGTIQTVAQHYNDLNLPLNQHPRMDTLLYLENSAGSGNNLGSTWTELRHLFEIIDQPGPGLCVDTQHLFAAGMSRLNNHESIVQLFDQIEAIGPKIKPIFHLNDSAVPFGRKVDRHASIGKGYIWSQNDEGLRYLINRCKEGNIDMILETPREHITDDFNLIRDKY